NPELVQWAFQVSKTVEIPVGEETLAFGRQFSDTPNAMQPPFVTIGDTLSASTYWHGHKLNQWANDWVKLYSGGSGRFMTSNMEDSGTLTSIHRLARIGRVDAERVLVLRTASNFTVPPPGKSAGWSATASYPERGRPALEAAYRVGSKVVNALTANWKIYEDRLPQPMEE
ncbi:MAG: purine nucleoside permease, partial [Proteobacteria bacterium]|nr:purine nucleoside permease [Pseudomonadota bacterium]